MPFGLGFGETLLIFLMLVLLFGPGKIPEIGGALGKGIRDFKDAFNGDHDDDALRRSDSPTLQPPVEAHPYDPYATDETQLLDGHSYGEAAYGAAGYGEPGYSEPAYGEADHQEAFDLEPAPGEPPETGLPEDGVAQAHYEHPVGTDPAAPMAEEGRAGAVTPEEPPVYRPIYKDGEYTD